MFKLWQDPKTKNRRLLCFLFIWKCKMPSCSGDRQMYLLKLLLDFILDNLTFNSLGEGSGDRYYNTFKINLLLTYNYFLTINNLGIYPFYLFFNYCLKIIPIICADQDNSPGVFKFQLYSVLSAYIV
jgi:hypothetical protein